MDPFSSSSSTGSSSKFSPDDLMDQLKTQLAQAYAEEFLEHKVLDTVIVPDIKNFGLLILSPLGSNNWFLLAFLECLLELKTVRGKCFDKCITKPGSSLSGSEGSCISRCVERYIEATGIVGRALFNQPR